MISEVFQNDIVVNVRDLKKNFGVKKAVDGVSFQVRKGEVFSLLGPNGAGKTTTISILEGLLRKDSGNIEILNQDPWEDHDSLKLNIGVMPQDFTFFEKLTAIDSLRFYCELFKTEKKPETFLKMVLLDDSKEQSFEKLSGGQKQKLGLALSLVNDPAILFLDEPTTGLDPSARRAIWGTIKDFKKQGKTIILTTHYMEEAEQLSDRVALINKGKIVALGTPGELILKYGGGRKLVLNSGTEMMDYLRNKNVIFLGNGNTIEIGIDQQTRISDLVRIIEDSGLQYSQITIRAGSLEDVFLNLVGEISGVA